MKQVTFYVLMNSDGKYVDLDRASGGYPYFVESPFRAHFWKTAEDALAYVCNEGFTVHEATLTVS